MSAVKRHAGVRNNAGVRKTFRQIPPADYSDELSEEHFKELEKRAAPALRDEEWEIVDGPAW